MVLHRRQLYINIDAGAGVSVPVRKKNINYFTALLLPLLAYDYLNILNGLFVMESRSRPDSVILLCTTGVLADLDESTYEIGGLVERFWQRSAG